MGHRMQHCDFCGEELGMFDKWPGDYESCGKSECAREVRNMCAADRDDARMAAEDDDYQRYR
jgi:hypothetical protein